ncbi:MAG: hydroxymethylbilane synthase [Candidatus Heimdallarchaeota archaeon]|nr:hydroxymethylbilane synthase [Candidatus Heimdallarchaeota archaeon]
MKKIIMGTRKSQLALKQAELVKNKIEKNFPFEVEIRPSSSLGDRDNISQLHTFRGSGVFSGTIEKALLEGKIDIAVHSLKDLPIIDTEGLNLVAYMQRHDFTDSLLIKKDKIVSLEPLKLKVNTRIATGSPRRQTQLKFFDPHAILLDIRGNVNTRISRLETDLVDGLIMASAVFERLDLDLPKNVIRVRLPINLFPTAPGQGAIAVQSRSGELEELSLIGDEITKEAVTSEREFLNLIGGGCDISVGVSAYFDKVWNLSCSIPTGKKYDSSLSFYHFTGDNLEQLFTMLRKRMGPTIPEDPNFPNIGTVLIARDQNDSSPYRELLDEKGIINSHMQVFQYQTRFDQLEDNLVVEKWKKADWIMLSSKRAVEFLLLLNKFHPRSAFRIGVVGPATAIAVRESGLPVHYVAAGRMEEFKEDMKQLLEIYPGKVLYLSGKHFEGKPLQDAEMITVYEAKPVELIKPFVPNTVVIFSKRSAKLIIEKLGKRFCSNWIAIGKTTGEYLLSENLQFKVAKTPTPKGVLDAIQEVNA